MLVLKQCVTSFACTDIWGDVIRISISGSSFWVKRMRNLLLMIKVLTCRESSRFFDRKNASWSDVGQWCLMSLRRLT